MEIWTNLAAWCSQYLFTIQLTDILDVAIIAYLVYRLLGLVRSTNSERIFKGVLFVLIALGLSDYFELKGLFFIFNMLMEWGVLALIILFQPEIRRVLEQVGGSRFSFLKIFNKEQQLGDIEHAITVTVEACGDMSKSRTGALIVFERKNALDEILRSGTKLDAEPSPELLKNIFFVKAPMHDGALIMREGRVLGAGCMLPLSRNVNLSRDLGMRHRAGIGMSENSDAVVVLVSEETGSISVAVGGMLKRHLTTETLRMLLNNELLPKDDTKEETKPSLLRDMRNILKPKKDEDRHE